MENAAKNIEQYAWAKRLKQNVLNEADQYLKLGLDKLWCLVTAQSLPRSIVVNTDLGSPITGLRLTREYGNYGWHANPLKEPWKITDPTSGYKFPTNDFQSFYESGLDGEGVFQRELADEAYLVNTSYPEKGERWGVDDGSGWVDDEGNKWTFIAYYNHWHLWFGWHGPTNESVYALDNAKGILLRMLSVFRDAYLYSAQLQYAQAGLVLLDRIADVYPAMDSSVYKWEEGYINSHGGSGQGKAVGCIWECSLAWQLLAAYDAFFSAMGDAGICEFLSSKASKYAMSNPKNHVSLIRKNMEDGIVLQIFESVKRGQIRGNFGMHQRTLAMAAVVLGDSALAKEWIDWLFQSGGIVHKPKHRVTGGNILAALVNDVDRDGFGNEASPTYNTIWLDQMKGVAEILENDTTHPEANLYRHVKFKKLFDSRYPLTMAGSFTPTIGDTGKAGNPFLLGNVEEHILAFEKYREPIYAQYAYFLNGNKLEGLDGNIFNEDPERVIRDIEQVIAKHGTLCFNSTNLTGYGFAALRDGESPEDTDASRGLWMYYGRNTGHGHRDTLNLGMHGFGIDLLPDHGYPEKADASAPRHEWVNNTISHNTVVVDQSKQSASWVGFPQHYHGKGKVQLIDVDAPQVYPSTTMYRRTCAYIQVDESHSYAIDFFRIKGGCDHHYSFHAAEGNVEVDGLKLTKQEQGSYAGAKIQYAQADPDYTPSYSGSGFHHLHHVERDSHPPTQYSVDWQINDTWGVYGNRAPDDIHVRFTMLGAVDDVALADGQPPQTPGNPESLKYVIAHKAREQGGLESQFVAVIEPYKANRTIASIEKATLKVNGRIVDDEDAAAVKIRLTNGRIDYVMNSIHKDIVYAVDDKIEFQGFFGMYSESNSLSLYGYVHDGSLLKVEGRSLIEQSASIQGSVGDFTKDMGFKNHIVIVPDTTLVEAKSLKGCYAYIENDGKRNAVYLIKDAQLEEDGRIILDIGDTTLIREYADAEHLDQGFIYDISEGNRISIPLTHEWKGEI